MANLPVAGLQVVAKDAASEQKKLDAFNKSVANLGVASQKAATQATRNLGVIGNLGNKFQSTAKDTTTAKEATEGFSKSLKSGESSIFSYAQELGILAAAVAAYYLALKTLNTLGKRGVAIEEVQSVFAGTIGSQQLGTLRAQTKGTIADFNLMQKSLKAIQGTSKETSKELLNNLGNVFYKTGVIARVTGENQEALQERLLEGIKEQRAEQLKSFGIIIDQQKAYEAYAKSINKPVSALTNLEKQAAFTREALNQFNATTEGLKGSEAANNIERVNASLANLKDELAKAITPAYAAVLSKVVEITTDLLKVFKQVGAATREMTENISSLLGGLKGNFSGAFSQIGSVMMGVVSVIKYVIAAFSIMSDAVITVIGVMAKGLKLAVGVIAKVVSPLVGIFKNTFGDINKSAYSGIEALAYNLGYGGGFVMGAFANGIMKGGRYVLEAVNFIAGIVADFLMGFSPPKKGVLHDIEKGAANVALAWAQGFTGSILTPMNDIANAVNDRLGAIGNMSREQIESRFSELDLAIRPYKESISIIKADMQAIMGFVEPALRVVDRQRAGILKAFEAGKGGDIDVLRNLDRQIDGLNRVRQAQENRADMAQMELALAEATQSQERALLQIQKDRLGIEEKLTEEKFAQDKAEKELLDKAKELTEKSGTGAAMENIAAGGAGFQFSEGAFTEEAVEPLGSATNWLEEAKARLKGLPSVGMEGAKAGLGASGAAKEMAALGGEVGKLKQNLKNIKESDPVKAIADKFSGLAAAIVEPLAAFSSAVTTTFDSLFVGDKSALSVAMTAAQASFTLGMTGMIAATETGKTGIMASLSVILGEFNRVFLSDTGIKAALIGGFGVTMGVIFGEGDESPLTKAWKAVSNTIGLIDFIFSSVFSDGASLFNQAMVAFTNTMATAFFNEDSIVNQALNAAKEMLKQTIEAFKKAFTDTAEGSLSGVLVPLKGILEGVLLAPFESALEGIANLVVDALNSVIRKYNDLPLGGAAELGELARIDISWRAKGGLGVKGAFMAGERGAELIVPSKNSAYDVFPNSATRALQRIAAMPTFGGGSANNTYNNQNNSQTVFNVNSPAQAMLIQRQRASMMRS